MYFVSESNKRSMQKQFERITDSQWQVISSFLNTQRKRKHCLRSVCDGLLWITRTGSQWRNLPRCYPPWRIVYYYFQKFEREGVWNEMNTTLNIIERLQQGKEGTPSILIADSQSIKLTPMIYENRGIDGNKKVNGRKRQLLVDTNGRIWGASVHAANIHDGIGALDMLDGLNESVKYRLEKILADQGYRGKYAKMVASLGFKFETPIAIKNTRGFVVAAKRWVVERTFAWLNFFRRIIVDYEHTKQSAVSFIKLANISMVLSKINFDAL